MFIYYKYKMDIKNKRYKKYKKSIKYMNKKIKKSGTKFGNSREINGDISSKSNTANINKYVRMMKINPNYNNNNKNIKTNELINKMKKIKYKSKKGLKNVPNNMLLKMKEIMMKNFRHDNSLTIPDHYFLHKRGVGKYKDKIIFNYEESTEDDIYNKKLDEDEIKKNVECYNDLLIFLGCELFFDTYAFYKYFIENNDEITSSNMKYVKINIRDNDYFQKNSSLLKIIIFNNDEDFSTINNKYNGCVDNHNMMVLRQIGKFDINFYIQLILSNNTYIYRKTKTEDSYNIITYYNNYHNKYDYNIFFPITATNKQEMNNTKNFLLPNFSSDKQYTFNIYFYEIEYEPIKLIYKTFRPHIDETIIDNDDENISKYNYSKYKKTIVKDYYNDEKYFDDKIDVFGKDNYLKKFYENLFKIMLQDNSEIIEDKILKDDYDENKNVFGYNYLKNLYDNLFERNISKDNTKNFQLKNKNSDSSYNKNNNYKIFDLLYNENNNYNFYGIADNNKQIFISKYTFYQDIESDTIPNIQNIYDIYTEHLTYSWNILFNKELKKSLNLSSQKKFNKIYDIINIFVQEHLESEVLKDVLSTMSFLGLKHLFIRLSKINMA